MKNINELTIKVTYTISLQDVHVSEKVYEELLEANNSFKILSPNFVSVNRYSNALDWISDNIEEKDCFEWECEIEEIETDEE